MFTTRSSRQDVKTRMKASCGALGSKASLSNLKFGHKLNASTLSEPRLPRNISARKSQERAMLARGTRGTSSNAKRRSAGLWHRQSGASAAPVMPETLPQLLTQRSANVGQWGLSASAAPSSDSRELHNTSRRTSPVSARPSAKRIWSPARPRSRKARCRDQSQPPTSSPPSSSSGQPSTNEPSATGGPLRVGQRSAEVPGS
mmetsp:Transcript_82964/g.240014  ORF Transcript_82964/g.240014 Transcript_82964/m.240014 type:complete len:202 (+) Transcript_82964:154-759(+)